MLDILLAICAIILVLFVLYFVLVFIITILCWIFGIKVTKIMTENIDKKDFKRR